MNNFYLFSFLITFILSFAHHTTARKSPFQQEVGFTLDLIHRDSPLSPLYNPSRSRLDLISDAFHRSKSRVSLIKKTSFSSDDIEAQLSSIPGEYIMEISIGTPPFKTLGIADTGSDLTWVQCAPCTNCYKQTTPIFNPKTSQSFKTLSCNSTQCSALGPSGSSCTNDNQCEYTMSYGDRSHSQGDLSSETFTFDSSSSSQPALIENVAFGCGHDNSGSFNETISGIIGLGGGPLSIVNQLNQTVNGKFSYCMVPIFSNSNLTSHINFGSKAIVEGPGTVSTPLVKKSPNTYYYLTLEAIKVANKSLNYKTYESSKTDVVDEGNIIIDSGTTLTMLPRDFYVGLEKELKAAIGVESTTDSQGQFGLCYKGKPDLQFPTITVSFTGADIDLPATSTFLEVEEGLVCLTLIPSDDLAIFGNLSQENFLVGYDLVKNQVSFKATDCTKQ